MPSANTPVLEIQATAGKPVELQSGAFVANAEFHRDGTDLLLTSPAGETTVIKDYFAQNPPPDINTTDGAHLSPEMVDAFLPPQHIGEYAANTVTANDASPAGQVTEAIGDATIVRADGTRVPAEVGTPIYPGDVIETSADGAVNLLFIDNTTFALSENARLSIDEYIYNTADQSGSTLFSMMQGVFVYTSGLVGKNDPGSVNIETPVGSIGIRGTVVAGEINPAGEDSKITIVDGAVILSNDGGTLELNDSFETAVLSSYQAAPDNIGQISAQTFTQTYDAVSGVAPATFDAVTGGTSAPGDAVTAPDATTAPETQTAPEAAVAPVTEEAPTTDGTTGETTGTVETAPLQEAVLPPPPPPGTETILMPPPGETTTFTSTTTTFGTTTDAFLPPPPPPGGTMTFLPPPPPPPSGDTTLNGTTSTNPPPAPVLNFIWGVKYLNGTPLFQGDDGIRMLGLDWNNGSLVARADLQDFVGAHHFELSYTINNTTSHLAATDYITGNAYTGGPNGAALQTFSPEQDLFHFDSIAGTITLINPLAMNAAINSGGISFSFIAKDSAGNTIAETDPVTTGHVNLDSADVYMATGGNIDGTVGGADYIQGSSGVDTMTISDTGDIHLGGGGNDNFYKYFSAFGTSRLIDGGVGSDTLHLFGTPGDLFDFTSPSNEKIKNIETIKLGNPGLNVTLSLQDVFEMTNGAHSLLVKVGSGSGTLNLFAGEWALPSGPLNLGLAGTNTTLTLTGNYGGTPVTLVIDQGTNTDGVVTNVV